MKNCLAAVLAVLAIPVAFAMGVEITDLGTLGEPQSFASAINDSGQIVGRSGVAGESGEPRIFLYDHGVMVDISAMYNIAPGDFWVEANDINNRSEIAGNLPDGHAMVISHGVVTTLNAQSGIFSTVDALNDSGTPVGYYLAPPGWFYHACFYDHGVMTAFGPLGEDAVSWASDVNDAGVIVGAVASSYWLPYHAFLFFNGNMSDINPRDVTESYAYGINNSGDIVGGYRLDSDETRAFIYTNGEFNDIGSSSSPLTVAYDINDSRSAVGSTWVEPTGGVGSHQSYQEHAFVYRAGVLTDLNTLLPPGTDWQELTRAVAINKGGLITGYGLVHGDYHAFLLTP